jgi:transcriptional regulator with XRE-family HTH domain
MDEQSITQRSFFDPGGFKPVSVGRRLREYRIEQGYSIKALAEKSGLAVNTLSLIENRKTSPSVNTLEQLAMALGIPLVSLFEPLKDDPHLIHTARGQRREMLVDGVRVEDCGLALEDSPLHPFIVTIPKGRCSGKQPIVHTGYEFIYCLSGTLQYFVSGKKYCLGSGDSLLFKARLPHQCVNEQDEPASYLLLMIPGDTKDVPGEAHFSSREE